MNSIYDDIMHIDFEVNSPIDELLAIKKRNQNFLTQIEYLMELRFGSEAVDSIEGFYIDDEKKYIHVYWIYSEYKYCNYDIADEESDLPLEWLFMPKDELENMIDSIRTEEERIKEEKQKELEKLKQLKIEEKELKEYKRLKQKYGN